jgi:anti-sigma regulatory factor (Ser/Thr protein kinase)
MSKAHSSPPPTWHTLAEFNLPNQSSAEQLARDRLAAAVHSLNLSSADLERLTTAVAAAALNAIEPSSHYRTDGPVTIRVLLAEEAVAGEIFDQDAAPSSDPETSDLITTVLAHESRRGWGFFLIERPVDDTRITGEERHHRIELFLYLE